MTSATPAPRRFGLAAFAIAGLFFVAPAAAVSGGLALAPFTVLAGLIAAPWRSAGRLLRRPPLPALAFALFGAWAIVSAAWSPAPNALLAAIKLLVGLVTGAALAYAAGRLAPRGAALARAAIVAAFIVLAALLAIEASFGMPLNRLDQPDALEWMLARNPGRGVSVLLLLLWPALFALRGQARWVFGTGALIASAVLSVQFEMYANTVAFGASAVFAAIAYAAPRGTILGLGGFFAALMIAAPVLARLTPDPQALPVDLPPSWTERLDAWRSVSQRLADAPLFGHGLDSARVMNAAVDRAGSEAAAIPLHPHNANLQIWLETGAIGGALAAAALWLGARALARAQPTRAQAAAVSGAIGAYAAHANLSFGVWQEWWVAAAFVAAAACAAVWTGSRTRDFASAPA